jgi:phosphohistidine swiveling domain-containing protein
LCHPDNEAVFTKERRSFLKLSLFVLSNNNLAALVMDKKFDKALEDKRLKSIIRGYIRDYYWIKTDFYSAVELTPKVVLDDILKEIKDNDKDSIKDELAKFDSNFADIIAKKKRMLSRYKLSREDMLDIDFAKLIILWGDIRKEQYMKGFHSLFVMLSDIAELFDIDYRSIAFYSVDEVLELLRSGKKLPASQVARKQKNIFTAYEPGKQSYFYGADAEAMLHAATSFKMSDQLAGSVGSRGHERFIKGVVKVIMSPNDEKFDKGKILVTSMTRVEFLPIMRKAKAIITDEGGIACHAAIVSREIGIPCIIGTKTATKVLKDGDFIEVDTEKGTVRKIR